MVCSLDTLAYFVLAVIFFTELRHLHVHFTEEIMWRKFTLAHETYIPIYQIFALLTLLIFEIGLIRGHPQFIYILAAVIFIALLLQLVFRPYRYPFDNISIIINSITLLAYLTLLIAR